jgi:hypothetical protein
VFVIIQRLVYIRSANGTHCVYQFANVPLWLALYHYPALATLLPCRCQ